MFPEFPRVQGKGLRRLRDQTRALTGKHEECSGIRFWVMGEALGTWTLAVTGAGLEVNALALALMVSTGRW